MCKNSKWITNKYTNEKLFVPCGHCEECLQANASRMASKIINHYCKPGTVMYFITLTYDNDHVPYIDLIDTYTHACNMVREGNVRNGMSFDVYRGSGKDKILEYEVIDEDAQPLCWQSLALQDIGFGNTDDIDEYINAIPLKPLQNDKDNELNGIRVGVLVYQDIQRFFKRLRINIKRYYNDDEKREISYFTCGEYGPTSCRPHWHIILFVDSHITLRELQMLVVKSWPFADDKRTRAEVQLAREPASYVASYVNSHSYVSTLLQGSAFRPKHSHSLHFGTNNPHFSPREVYYNVVQKRVPGYYIKSLDVFNQEFSRLIPYPEYIQNKYFPKFLGQRFLSDTEIFDLISVPQRCLDSDIAYKVGWSREARLKMFNQVHRSYAYFSDFLSRQDYARLFIEFHRVKFHQLLLSVHYEQTATGMVEELPIYCYDNIADVYDGAVDCPYIWDVLRDMSHCVILTDPRKFPRAMLRSNYLVAKYRDKDKSKRVNDILRLKKMFLI